MKKILHIFILILTLLNLNLFGAKYWNVGANYRNGVGTCVDGCKSIGKTWSGSGTNYAIHEKGRYYCSCN